MEELSVRQGKLSTSPVVVDSYHADGFQGDQGREN